MKITYKNLTSMFLWLILGLISLFFIINSENYIYANIYLGIITLVHGLFYFNRYGGNFLFPANLYLLFSSLLIGFSGIFINFHEPYTIVLGHFIALIISFFIQISVFHLFLEKNNKVELKLETKFSIAQKKNLIIFGLFIFLGGSAISNFHPNLSFLRSSSVYVFLLILAIYFTVLKRKIKFKHIVALIFIFFIYYLFFFSNFGRINLVTLVSGMLMLITIKLKGVNFKFIITLFFYPLIMIGSYLRSGDFWNVGSGIGSIIAPLYNFGEIIQLYLENQLVLRYGETIYAALVVLIPRDIWGSKPWNFNREITYIFSPEYIQYGHSDASVLYAEMFFNFGFIGVILSILFLGIFIKWLDKLYILYINQIEWDYNLLVKLLIIIILSSGLLNLLWGGFSTHINRDIFRILTLIMFYIIFMVLLKGSKKLKQQKL